MIDLPATDTSPTSPRALPPGTAIGHFETVRVMADTSLSIVYFAIDRASDTEVVVKEYMPQQLTRRERSAMRPRQASNAAALARGLQAFMSAAQLLSQIDQPTLVHVNELIEANATAYQVMPHRGGTKLLHVRQEMRVPPDERALRVLLDGLLDALQPLHQRDTLHGAVTPGNILLLAEGRPLLLGPELARAEVASGLVESLMARVEPSFAAPEQYHPSPRQPVGAWTDLYSVAATIRFCIGGELPPPADSPFGGDRRESMTAMLQRRFGHLPSVRYSALLMTVLDAALDPNTSARPQSVAEFRAALETMPSAGHVDAWITGAPAAPSPARLEPSFDAGRTTAAVAPAPAREPERAAPPKMPPQMPPRVLPKPQRSAHHLLWAGIGSIVLVLVVGVFGWWRSSQPVPSALPTSAGADPVTTAAPPVALPADPPPAPTPAAAPAPTPEPSPPPIAEPAAPRLRPAPAVPTERPKATPASPRDACAGRTQFALYRCMQTQCAQRAWAQHPQCERLRATDSVD